MPSLSSLPAERQVNTWLFFLHQILWTNSGLWGQKLLCSGFYMSGIQIGHRRNGLFLLWCLGPLSWPQSSELDISMDVKTSRSLKQTNPKSKYVLFCFFFFLVKNYFNNIRSTKSIKFQRYNSTVCHIYTALCVNHPELNFLSSPNIWPLLPISTSTHSPFPLVTSNPLSMSTSFIDFFLRF